jgi:hypothetical protein
MSSDMNRKTLRHFYCRDALWHSFERMSEDFDRGIDELVNEAMRLYAREKGYLPTENDARPMPPPARPSARAPTPPPPPPVRSTAHYAHPGRPAAGHGLPPPAVGGGLPDGGYGGPDAPAPPLYLIFQNQKYLIDKEQFIIGRGSKSSDLAIRDGNISRKHAAIIRRSGSYYIKDLGSTNGIDFNGVRVDNKRIEEGDRFMLCDYELRFTYR